MTTIPTLRSIGACALLWLLVACGGGGDGGVGTGGTGSFSSGPIGGFGSVIVNGVHFDDSAARVEDDDGATRSRTDLRLGMVVAIDAGAIVDTASGPSAAARTIRIDSELQGPVAAVDRAARTLVVLGQTVQVGAGTVFDERFAGGLDGVAAGRSVVVYGLHDVAGARIVATRIEPSADPGVLKLRGPVTTVDIGARMLRIGGATFRHAGMMAPPDLAPGRFVRMRLDPGQDALGRWNVASFEGGRSVPSERDKAEVEGVVGAFRSAASFEVDGLPVDAGGASFPDGSAGLRNGARVEVEGVIRAGVLVASRVRIDSDDDVRGREIELDGAIDSLDRGARSFVLRGVTVFYGGAVEFDKGSEANLGNGVVVEVKGRLAADGTRLDAARIRFER